MFKKMIWQNADHLENQLFYTSKIVAKPVGESHSLSQSEIQGQFGDLPSSFSLVEWFMPWLVNDVPETIEFDLSQPPYLSLAPPWSSEVVNMSHGSPDHQPHPLPSRNSRTRCRIAVLLDQIKKSDWLADDSRHWRVVMNCWWNHHWFFANSEWVLQFLANQFILFSINVFICF